MQIGCKRAYQSVLERLGDNSENTWDSYMKEVEKILLEEVKL